MSKPFFEVFPNLQLNTDIHDLMGQTEVERVSATKRRDFLRVYLKSTRLIQKADIWIAEQEIKKQLFPDANLKVVATTEDATNVAIPMRKGAETASLLEAVNQALEELSDSGELTRLSEKYFGMDISQNK